MKRIASFTLIMVTLFWIVPVINFAQTPNETSVYTVQPGDTGWDLSRRYYEDPTIWQRIVDMNTFLQEPGRVFEDAQSRIILVLRPGEQLVGLERLNVAPPTAVPIETLIDETTPAPVAEANFNWISWLLWLVMTAITLTIVWFVRGIWRDRREVARQQTEASAQQERLRQQEQERLQQQRERELRQDPITSGPAMVPGGIPATDTPRLTNFFDQQAVNRFATRYPNIDRNMIRANRIGPIEEGTITGEGLVGYLGGEFRPRRIEQPLAAYRARYRFPDGTEEDLITLQACMNPVAYGGDTYRGFNFTPHSTAVPTPEPERPAPQPAPHPAIAVRRIREAAQAESQNTVTIGDDVMVFPLGYHITVDRTTNDIHLESNSVEMTLKAKSAVAAETARPTATGTSN
ncbi:MAG: LysM peptidoglycan-binding domain-containing protein [Candidatus Zambryskibacteria bacterium]|nr:LysM peptidoglycan-binding domain-containing protein [Candidatus Zambryskibacteria bacterium]